MESRKIDALAPTEGHGPYATTWRKGYFCDGGKQATHLPRTDGPEHNAAADVLDAYVAGALLRKFK